MSDSSPILIVDDEEVVRVALTDILDLSGYATVTASNGADAITIFEGIAQQPGTHIVILDLMMPGINGVETMRRLSALDPTVQVIIASGFDRSEVIHRFNAQDIDPSRIHFLQKPYTIKSIVDVVERCRRGISD